MGRRRGAERESTGGRVVADRTRGWGLTTTTPQRRGFLFVPASSFLFLSPLPDPTHPPSESFDSSARLCHPLALSSSTSSFSSSSSSYHRPPKIRVRYYLSPDRSRSTTPANVLFRFLASRSYPPGPPLLLLPAPVMAVRPLPVPAQFNCWHFIKSIDSAPSCLRLCKLMPRPTGRELFLASAFVGIGMWRRAGGETKKGGQGGARKSSTKNLEINISSAASSGGERALTWPRV